MENFKSPAFPKNLISYFDKNINEQVTIPSSSGLTKREYFAGMAMEGLANAWLSDNVTGWDCAAIVKQSIEFADELLKQLENE